MDLAPLRSMVRDINFAVHGVPAVVAGVETRIIWLTPATEPRPGGDFGRAEPRRSMAIRRDDIVAVPRGTLIQVTEHLRTAPSFWKVDSMDAVFSDHHRVVVVPDS